MACKAIGIMAGKGRRTVCAQNEVGAPRGELQRQPCAVLSGSADGERLIANFPAVAVRTMEDAAAVERLKSLDLWQEIHDASRQ